jgi:ATP-dependent DNA helicase RecG
MTEEKVRTYLGKKENTWLEYKESKQSMPSNLFDTVCAFLNREGGIILLGVNDDGILEGIDVNQIENIKKNIVTSSNDPSCLNPPFILHPQVIVLDGFNVIVLSIPPGSQVFKHGNSVYYRENDSDLTITDVDRITQIQLNKRNYYSESNIYSALNYSDFNEDLFSKARQLIKIENPDHPWLKVTNERLLELANFKRKDFQSGAEGYTLASAIVFGKDQTIQQILSSYKIEVLVRKENPDRYDDRLTLRTNLLDSYDQLMQFFEKHFPDKFYSVGTQRISLRTYIFREIVANILAHREYTNALPTTVTIFKDKIEITNPNNPYKKGLLALDSFSPYPKNPTIAKFMIELGWVEEVGSGVINVNKYLPLYFDNCIPQFLENDIFTTTLPTSTNYLGEFIYTLFNFLNLDWTLFKATEIDTIKKLPISTSLTKSDDDTYLFSIVSTWLQESIKLTSLDVFNKKDLPSLEAWLATSSEERSVKLFGNKFNTLFKVLFASISASALSSLMYKINYSNRITFNKLYLKPLINNNLIKLTIPDTPTSPKQQYLITDLGKHLIGGYKLS